MSATKNQQGKALLYVAAFVLVAATGPLPSSPPSA